MVFSMGFMWNSAENHIKRKRNLASNNLYEQNLMYYIMNST